MPDPGQQFADMDGEEQYYLRVVRDGSPDQKIHAWQALTRVYQAQGRPGMSVKARHEAERLADERSFSARLTSEETGATLRGAAYLVLGLVVTLVSYWVASIRGEGHYLILYGPIVVGLLLLWWGVSRLRRRSE